MQPVSARKLRFFLATLPGANRLPMYVTAWVVTRWSPGGTAASWSSEWGSKWATAGWVCAEFHLFPSPGRQGLCSRYGRHVHSLTGRLSLYNRHLLLFLAQHLPALASGWVPPWWRRGG